MNTSYSDSGTGDDSTPQWLRLDTTWRKDNWYKSSTLELGDSTTDAAHWGGSVNFAGLSFYKNYALHPNLDIRSLPLVTGYSDLPQNMQLKVNGVPVGNYQVNPGSYQFYNIPVTDGSGTISVKSTDKSGKVTTYSIPYFADANLLRPGISSYSYQFGWVRENYGIDSFDYGKAATVLNYDKGITPIWTYQIHSSLLSSQQTLGTTQFIGIGDYSILSVDTAASNQNSGEGALGGLGFQVQNNGYSLITKYQLTSPHFTQLSSVDTEDGDLANGYQTSVSVSVPIGSWASFSASAFYQHSDDNTQPSSHIYTTMINANLAHNLDLVGTYQANFSDIHQWNLALSLNYQFDENNTASTSYQQNQDSSSQYLEYTNSHSYSGGKYLTSSISGTKDLSGADNDLRASIYLGGTQTGDYSTSYYRYGNQSQVSATADGSVLWMDNHVFLTPTLNDGFVLVDTSKISGVNVNQGGVSLGNSNNQGLYVVPDLTAYTVSDINISPDLPLNLKEINHDVKIMPYYRSGVLVKFDIRHIHQILVRLINENRKPLTIGTSVDVLIDGKQQTLVVGSNGLAYFSSEGHHFNGHVLTGKMKSGTFTIDFKPTKKTIVRTTAIVRLPLQTASSKSNIAPTAQPAKPNIAKNPAHKKPRTVVRVAKPTALPPKEIVLPKTKVTPTLTTKNTTPTKPHSFSKVAATKAPIKVKPEKGKAGPQIYISGEFVTVLYYEYKELFKGEKTTHKRLMTFSPFSLNNGEKHKPGKVEEEINAKALHFEGKVVRQSKKISDWLTSNYNRYFS